MPFTVIYDACVLYPASLRDILIRVGQAGLVHARWTDRILDECFGSILRNRPDLRPDRLQRTRQLMGEAIRDVVVEGYENLAAGLELPDEDDRHVLAAAIKAGAQIIVTFNLRDFPPQQLGEIEAQAPDTFLYNLIDLSPGTVAHVIRSMEEDLGSRPGIDYVLATLKRAGLRKSMDAIRPYLSYPRPSASLVRLRTTWRRRSSSARLYAMSCSKRTRRRGPTLRASSRPVSISFTT